MDKKWDWDDIMNDARLMNTLINTYGAVQMSSKPKETGFRLTEREDNDGRKTSQDDG